LWARVSTARRPDALPRSFRLIFPFALRFLPGYLWLKQRTIWSLLAPIGYHARYGTVTLDLDFTPDYEYTHVCMATRVCSRWL
jgi:hypothetical protein